MELVENISGKNAGTYLSRCPEQDFPYIWRGFAIRDMYNQEK